MRHLFYLSAVLALIAVGIIGIYWQPFFWGYAVVVPLVLLGIRDSLQTRRAVLRNFPVIGHGRYLLELIRPEINQYFIESNTDGTPFNRETRSLVYQRAKGQLDTLPFGTQWDVDAQGYEWINHSMLAKHGPKEVPRVLVGEQTCAQPYSASLLNISAMSFGALSINAIRALSQGAKEGGFAHNTGEGGISPHHLAGGADLIWQIGTGYFGCRDAQGNFDPELFKQKAATPSVKMIELKLSQGAKPGHGGILPAAKVTPEIAAIRHVPLGEDVLSPPAHSAFSTPIELLEFVTDLRELSAGKPIGFKLCIGSRSEFLGICRAMQETRMHPDFIVIDGGEGGTGAAPLEFSNSIGTPLTEGLAFVHNALTGFRVRDKITLIASGKITSGFHMARAMALGADLCYSARGMMMALGCIQARRCNSNECPVGVATQIPGLVAGLDIRDKAVRTRRYHYETLDSLMQILGAAGLSAPHELEPRHIMRRVDPVRVMSYAEIFDFIEPGALLFEPVPESFEADWLRARSDSFA